MRFGVLGPLEVIAEDGPVPLGGQKQRVLLALLLTRPGRVVSVDALVQGLWADEPPRSAAKTLQSYVVHLRQALEPGRPRGSVGTVLVTREPGYLLRVEPGELDAAWFEELATRGRRLLAAGAAEGAAATLWEALALWRGEAFEEFPQVDACATEAARLVELRLGAVEERVEADLALGRHRQLLAELDDLTRQHPLRERLWGQLLLALYRSGRQADALLAYQRARATLVEELGVEPGVELRRLHAAILAQDPQLHAAPVGWPEPGRRGELPAALEVADPVFVGRAAELGWLRAAWTHASSGHGGAVLVSGPAGIGKTRLAAELAHKVHKEGALVLYGRCDPPPSSPLQPLEQALAVVGTSTKAVPLPEGAQPPAAFGAALAGYVAPRSGERPGVLLVLDDLHLADAATLEALAGLAGAAEGRRLLVLGAYRDDAPAAALAGLLGRPPLSAAARRRLEGLSVPEMARIVAVYSAEEESLQAARTLLEATGGVPSLVHQAAGDWARARATRRVEQAAARSVRHRRDLRAVQAQVADNVVELQQLRGRRGAVAGAEVAESGLDRSPPAAVLCPYKGLACFEPADRELFFGRERLVAELVTHLVGPGLLGVVGPSGSGKSSVVRAGLLPALADGVLPGSSRWTRVVIRPGEHPLDELARVAQRAGWQPTGAVGAAGEDGEPADQPIRALADAGGGDGQRRLVLVVDQFEEVFTSCRDEREQTAFLAALTAAAWATDGYASVVLVVRADYYGNCAADRKLAELLAADHVLVGPMTEDELQRAIVRPAERAGLRLEAGLAEQLLADVAGEPGGLPLLSTALLESWQRREGRTLTQAGYHASGGVSGAVARLADRTFGRLNPGQQTAARRLLLRLAGPGGGDAAVGRRVPLAELDLEDDPDLGAALAALTDARLLTTAEATVEVAHEALLRQWPRLRGWLEEDTQGRALHRHLIGAAQEWQTGGRDPGELYRGARLAAALDWATAHPADLNELERAYLDHSRQAAEHEVAEARRRAEQEARSNRRLRGLLAGLAAVLVVAVAAGTLAVVQQGRATRAALLADARRLVAQALVEGDLDRSLLLAAQANRLDDSVDTRGALLASLLRSPQAIGVLGGAGDRLLHLAVSPDGRTLAAGDEAGRTRLWDTSTRRPLPGPPQLPKLNGEPDPLQTLAFSPDGRLLITAGSSTIHRWDLAAQQVAGSFDILSISPEAGLSSMAVSRDGRRLAVATQGKVPWLDLKTWEQASAPLILDNNSWPDRLTLSPDGRMLAMTTTTITTGGATGRSKAVIWDLASRRQIRSLDADGTLAFSPDSRTLAASHRQRGEILLLDPATGKRRRTLTGHTAGVLALGFSHDGATLASTDENDTAIVWDLATGRARETLRGHAGGVTGVAFSPDDRTLYTSSWDRSVIVWDLAGDRRLGRPFAAGMRTSSQSFGNAQSIGKGGALLARGHDDGTVTLVDLTRRAPAGTPLHAHSGAVQALALSPDGRLLASADAHTAIVWDLATRRPTGPPIPVTEMAGLTISPDIAHMALSPDGRTLAIGDGLGRVTLWDLTSRTRWVLQAAGANTFQFSPDGTILAVASHGGEVRLWDVADRSLVPRRRLPADRSDASAVAFTPDGRTLATSGHDGKVVLWDIRTGKQLGLPLVGHASGVASGAFSPDGRVLATVDGEAILWDVASHKQIGAALPARSEGPHAVAFLPGGSQLAAASPSGSVLMWDVNPASWRTRACSIAGRTLTRAEWDEFLPGRPYQDVCPG